MTRSGNAARALSLVSMVVWLPLFVLYVLCSLIAFVTKKGGDPVTS